VNKNTSGPGTLSGVNLHVYVHFEAGPGERLAALLGDLIAASKSQTEAVKGMGLVLDGLTKQVEDNTSVEAGAAVLIQTIADELKAARASDNPDDALQALEDKLLASKSGLAAAIAANTPADKN
jgi:hypothetical protein